MLIVLLGIYMRLLGQHWPTPTWRSAALVGATWTVLTIGFEFGFGHYVAGDSWAKLLEQYDVTRANLWILVPIWIAIGPAATRVVRSRRH